MNKHTFTWGRLAAHDMRGVEAYPVQEPAGAPTKALDVQIALRARIPDGVSGQGLCRRYRAAVDKVRGGKAAARPLPASSPRRSPKNLFKLMAYKDEYEVARLYTDGSSAKKMSDKFEGDFRSNSIWRRRSSPNATSTGHLREKRVRRLDPRRLRLLARLKFLRGTSFDPFGRTASARPSASWSRIISRCSVSTWRA